MRILYVALVALAACEPLLLPDDTRWAGERAESGQCPAGETCSSRTPRGLQFDVTEDDATSFPAVAVGGTQELQLQYHLDTGSLFSALALPYTADDDGGLGVTIDDISGSAVTVRGATAASSYVRILAADDGELFDRKLLTAAELDAVALAPLGDWTVPTGAFVWATGNQWIVIALTGQVHPASQARSAPDTSSIEERIVDTSMQLTLDGAYRIGWDTLNLPDAAAGTYSIAVTVGGQPMTTLELVVVDHADALDAIDPPTTIGPGVNLGNGQLVCFQATNADRIVEGLEWQITVDGVPDVDGSSCTYAETAKTSGTVAVEASAGGQTATVSLTVR